MEEMITSLILFPDPLSWTYYLIVPPWRSRSIGLFWNPLPITLTKYIMNLILRMPLHHLIYPMHMHTIAS